ncbi:hypothetical protein BASA81_006784 [Batrachochytrium salamandrivorans]|nr:hypothetical protein BASA81_006784 [Batrachochytrium salamandrivorans]
MYSSLAKTETTPASEYEVFRLRKNLLVANLNKLIIEGFATVSSLAFLLVLLNQGGAIDLDSFWYIISYRTCGSTTPVQDDDVARIMLGLGIVAAILFGVKILLRVTTVVLQIKRYHANIKPGKHRLVLLFLGFLLTVVEPWNGISLVEAQFIPLENQNEYKAAMSELRGDWLLLVVETLPQFIIQTVYAAIVASIAHLGLPPAWYVSMVTTVMQLTNQLHEVIYLQVTMPKVKVWAGKVNAMVEPLTRRASLAANNVVERAQNVQLILPHHPELPGQFPAKARPGGTGGGIGE